jgi:hypothetical protein
MIPDDPHPSCHISCAGKRRPCITVCPQVLARVETRRRSVAEVSGAHPVSSSTLGLGRVLNHPRAYSPCQRQQLLDWGGLTVEMYGYDRRGMRRYSILDSLDVN